MKKLIFIAVVFISFAVAGPARSQQLDAAFSVSAAKAPSASSATGQFFPQSMGGGTFPGFSADYLIRYNLGIGFEADWRASRNIYAGVQPFRPVFYTANAVWAPKLSKYVSAELQGGIGASSTRFYQPFVTCSFVSCTDFSSVNHFLGHIGGGVRIYIWRNLFIRPEAHVYFINGNVEFSGPRVERYGVALGYSLRSQ
jgi:hypothetical protein